MKSSKYAAILLIAFAVLAVHLPAAAEQGGAESITITIDRAVMPTVLFHPSLRTTDPVTLTVHDFVIRNYFGIPIEHLTIQTASGRTEIPIETVEEFYTTGWLSKNTEDIERIAYVVPVYIVLTDGEIMEDVIMNADFGTIEGETDLGEFFVDDPHTVKHLKFNR